MGKPVRISILITSLLSIACSSATGRFGDGDQGDIRVVLHNEMGMFVLARASVEMDGALIWARGDDALAHVGSIDIAPIAPGTHLVHVRLDLRVSRAYGAFAYLSTYTLHAELTRTVVARNDHNIVVHVYERSCSPVLEERPVIEILE